MWPDDVRLTLERLGWTLTEESAPGRWQVVARKGETVAESKGPDRASVWEQVHELALALEQRLSEADEPATLPAALAEDLPASL